MQTTEFLESVETFKVSFGGKKTIEAELFTKTINNTIELVKASANVIDPQAFLRLEIQANKEGSFETVIDAVARYADTLVTKENVYLAIAIVEGFAAFFGIKQHLKGKKPKEIKVEKDTSIIVNQENSNFSAPKKIADAFFENAKIENSIINIISALDEGDREYFNISSNSPKGTNVNIEQADYEHMSKKILDPGKPILSKNKEDTQIIENYELIVKKPDLIGDSKWDLIMDKNISAKIIDQDFLKKVKDGKIQLSGGCKIICSLEIKREMDENYNLVNVEYVVHKVSAIKDKEEQLRLFD